MIATAICGSDLHIEKGDSKADDIITHRLKLDEAPHGYEIFSNKQDSCMKVVLTP